MDFETVFNHIMIISMKICPMQCFSIISLLDFVIGDKPDFTRKYIP